MRGTGELGFNLWLVSGFNFPGSQETGYCQIFREYNFKIEPQNAFVEESGYYVMFQLVLCPLGNAWERVWLLWLCDKETSDKETAELNK
jgi:hypothetical protein